MVKVEVLENFSLKEFDKLKNLVRKNEKNEEKGKLYKGDTFECTDEMCVYLTGDNPLNKEVVKVIEVKPEKEKVDSKTEYPKEEKSKAIFKKKSSKK